MSNLSAIGQGQEEEDYRRDMSLTFFRVAFFDLGENVEKS